MSKRKIDVRFGNLFPWIFLLVSAVVLVLALLTITARPFLSLSLIFITGFILTAQEGTDIDKSSGIYREYKSFFFIKTGRAIKYGQPEKIFINTSKTTQRSYTAHTNKSSIFENLEYNGFLKFSDGKKVHLLTKRKKEVLIKSLNKVATFLDVPLEDNSVVKEEQ